MRAAEAFQRAQRIATDRTETDPDNTEWQRDLSVSHDRIGDVRRAQGDLSGALDAYNRGLEIAARLAALDPSNAQWQEDLAISRKMIAELAKRRKARSWLHRRP
jgi:hypothetical protein